MKAVLRDLDGTLVDSEPSHALLGASEDRVHAALVSATAAGPGGLAPLCERLGLPVPTPARAPSHHTKDRSFAR